MKYSFFKEREFYFFIWGDFNKKKQKKIVGLKFLTAQEFANCKEKVLPIHFYYIMKEDHLFFKEAILQLHEYFQGKRKKFDLNLCVSSHYFKSGAYRTTKLPTEFEIKVWENLQMIPYGKTISYQALAKRVGTARAARAVGNANSKNPLPIFVPCHRVILSTGEIGSYSAGNNIKKVLLELEKNNS